MVIFHINHGFPIVFPWFSHGFPMVFHINVPLGLGYFLGFLGSPSPVITEPTQVNDMIFSIDTATQEANDAYQVGVGDAATCGDMRRPCRHANSRLRPSNYSFLPTINHSEIGVICTNLDIERGPHTVWKYLYGVGGTLQGHATRTFLLIRFNSR